MGFQQSDVSLMKLPFAEREHGYVAIWRALSLHMMGAMAEFERAIIC